jgi:hypothetical protein
MPRVKQDPSIPVFEFVANPDKSELSANTVNIYRSYLNKITAASYKQSLADKRKKVIKNKKDLMSKYQRVVDIINSSSDSRQIKCGMYSAVFYAIGQKNLNRNKKMKNLVEEFRKVYYDDKYKDYLQKKAESKDAQDSTPSESS